MVADLPEAVIACGGLTGLVFPRPGPLPGVPVEWNHGALDAHGTVDCPGSCRRTGSDGIARLTFIPNQEAPPAGIGAEGRDKTIVQARVNHLAGGGNAFGGIPLLSRWGPWVVEIGWHKAVKFTVSFESTIVGLETGDMENDILATAVATGEAPSKWNATGVVPNEGLFRGGTTLTITTPGQLRECGPYVARGPAAQPLVGPSVLNVSLQLFPALEPTVSRRSSWVSPHRLVPRRRSRGWGAIALRAWSSRGHPPCSGRCVS